MSCTTCAAAHTVSHALGRFVFADITLTSTTDAASGEITCAAAPSDCTEWPTTFACTPGSGFACEASGCRELDSWLMLSQWTGPSVQCEWQHSGHAKCSTAHSLGGTTAVFAPDGSPVQGVHGSCGMSPQSSACSSTVVEFADVDTERGAVPAASFRGNEMAACLADPVVCANYCHGRGTCDGPVGACRCDAGWRGNRCDEVSAPCRAPWGEWSVCSQPCGVGTQTRTASFCGPHDNKGQAMRETRVCNVVPCPVVTCDTCTGGSSGTCRNPFDGVCFHPFEGTSVCPAGSVACASNCDQCAPGSVGPCRQDSDGRCVPFHPGTTSCPAGASPCGGMPSSPRECTGCWPGTSGLCQQSNTVCWAADSSGKCPAGTTSCAVGGSSLPAALAVADIQLDGLRIDERSFGREEQLAFAASVASVLGAEDLAVVVSAVRSTAPNAGRWARSGQSWQPPAVSLRIGFAVVAGAAAGSGPSAARVAALLPVAVEDGSLAHAIKSHGHAGLELHVRLVSPIHVLNSHSDGEGTSRRLTTTSVYAAAAGGSSVFTALVVGGVVTACVGMLAAGAVAASSRKRCGQDIRVHIVSPSLMQDSVCHQGAQGLLAGSRESSWV